MRNPEVSSQAMLLLLLTGHLTVERRRRADVRDSAKPLSLSELNKLRRGLKTRGYDLDDLNDLIFPNVDEVLHELSTAPDYTKRLERLLERGLSMARAIDSWRQRGIWVLCRDDDEYPQGFKEHLGDNAPTVIYGWGDTDLFENDGLAVVGSRRASRQVLEYAHSVGRQAEANDFMVVSGGARGVDQTAMHGALDAGGTSIGVLADGLSRAAIAHDYREHMADGRLLLISPFDPNARFNVGHAMGRNKLIYALSRAGLVVASDHKKGGTWAGATEQLNRLKYVPLFVRKTSRPSRGLAALQELGARQWPDPADSDATATIFEQIRNGTVDTGTPDYQQPTLGVETALQGSMLAESSGQYGKDVEEEIESTDDTEREPREPKDRLFDAVRPIIREAQSKSRTLGECAHKLGLSQKLTREWRGRLLDDTEPLMLSDPGQPYGSECSTKERLFKAVTPIFLETLHEPLKCDEVAELLDLPKGTRGQTQTWLKRLVDEGRVERLKRPVRYVAKK